MTLQDIDINPVEVEWLIKQIAKLVGENKQGLTTTRDMFSLIQESFDSLIVQDVKFRNLIATLAYIKVFDIMSKASAEIISNMSEDEKTELAKKIVDAISKI